MNSNKNIKVGAILSYFAIGFNIIAGIIYTPWMIKMIGDSDYGIYTLAVSVINFFLLDFGLSTAISKFISKYKSEGNKERINEFLAIIFKLYFLIDLLVVVVLLIFYFLVGDFMSKLTPSEIEKFKIVYIIIAVYSIISFPMIPFNGIIISYEKFILLKSLDFFQKFLTIILIVIGLLLGGGLYYVVIINSMISLVISYIKMLYIQKKLDISIKWKYSDSKMLKNVFSFSIWSTIISFASRFGVNFAPTILGRFSGTSSITMFSIAYTIESYIFLIANALNGLYLPKITQLVVEHKEKDVFKLMIKVGRIQTMLLGAIIITFSCFGMEFMILWMGESYSGCYFIILVMIIPDLFVFSMDIGNNMLIVKDKIKFRAIIYTISNFICLILLLILIPMLGAYGAGLAIGVSSILMKTIMMIKVYEKHLKFNMKIFIDKCYKKMIIPTIITLFFGMFLNYSFGLNGSFVFFIKCIILMVFYCVLLYFIYFDNYERNLILSFYNKFIHRRL